MRWIPGFTDIPNGGTYYSGNATRSTRVVPVENAATITINADTTDLASQDTNTQSGTLTINAPTGTPYNGQKIMLRIRCANSMILSFNAIFAFSADLPAPGSTSSGSKYDYLGFVYNSTTTKWQVVAKVFGF